MTNDLLVRKRSNDGLVTGEARFVETWDQITENYQTDKLAWLAMLREHGIKAAHPDDGWVDRKNFKVSFCYPHFNDGVQVGDEICLGWHSRERNYIVKVTKIEDSIFGNLHYYFAGYPGQGDAQGMSSDVTKGSIVEVEKQNEKD